MEEIEFLPKESYMHPAEQFSHWLSTPLGAFVVVFVFAVMVVLAIRDLRPKSTDVLLRSTGGTKYFELHGAETFALNALFLVMAGYKDVRRVYHVDVCARVPAADPQSLTWFTLEFRGVYVNTRNEMRSFVMCSAFPTTRPASRIESITGRMVLDGAHPRFFTAFIDANGCILIN